MKKRFRLAVVSPPPPMPYRAAFFRHLANHPDIDLTVYYATGAYGERRVKHQGFGISLKWDVPTLSGYNYHILKSLLPWRKSSPFLGQISLGVIPALVRGNYQAVIIYGYSYFSSLLAYLTARLTKIPILFRGESTLLYPTPSLTKEIKRLFLPFVFKRIAAFLAIGSLNREFYRSYGVKEEKIFFAPYAVDNDFFLSYFERYKGEKQRLREKLNLPKEKILILFVGKLIERKKPFDLLSAFEKLSCREKAALLFVGEGKERERLEQYTRERGLSNVFFAGFANQTDLPRYYALSDIFVLPSRRDNWGLVVNEAMNFELPIITSDAVGSSYDLVKPGENGFVFPTGDVTTLSLLLDQLIADEPLRKRMGKRSREVIKRFNFEEAVSGVLSALNYLASRRKG